MKKFFWIFLFFFSFVFCDLRVFALPLSSEQADMTNFNDCLEFYEQGSSEFAIFEKYANPNHYSMFGFLEDENYFLGYFDGENFSRNRTLNSNSYAWMNSLAPVNKYRNYGQWINAYEPCDIPDYYSSSYIIGSKTTFPFFNSWDSAISYFTTSSKDGLIYSPVPPFDPYNNNYSEDIPAPEVYRDGDKIMFSNSSPDMFLLANIRWYSVDDITLFKESLSWKYRPDSIIHSDLEWLLTVNDLYPSVNGVDLYTLGNDSFEKFLAAYPIENRTYLGGTNAIGNYLFGYNDALSSLKMILGQIDSSFNAPELFFRYYVPLSDGTYKCGKWTKYSRSLPSGASDGAIDGRWNVEYQVSDAPLTSDDVIGSKPYDTSGMTTFTSKDNTVVVDFDSPNYTLSIDNLNQITSLFGQFPSFVSTVFSFLPSWILSLIGCTITLLVGLAVYHALRG